MAKILRKTQKIFGSSAGANQIGKFGSLAAGSPTTTTDPTVIQALSNYLVGWFAAVVGGNSPSIEDMNAICFLYAYQLAYLMQAGVAEWDSGTTYYQGSIVNSGGILYVSLTDNNLNNLVTDVTNWHSTAPGVSTVSSNYFIAQYDDVILADATGASFNVTLPLVAATPIGKRYVIKRINSNTNIPTVKGNGAELIDGANTFPLTDYLDSMTVVNTGSAWSII